MRFQPRRARFKTELKQRKTKYRFFCLFKNRRMNSEIKNDQSEVFLPLKLFLRIGTIDIVEGKKDSSPNQRKVPVEKDSLYLHFMCNHSYFECTLSHS